MKQLIFNIIEKIFSIMFWAIEFYCVFPKKVEKAKEWIMNYLNQKYKDENIKVNYVNHIESKPNGMEVMGKYYIKEKTIELKKLDWNKGSFYEELVALHELCHHYCNTKFSTRGCESESFTDRMVLGIIKIDFPKWIIITMKISLSCYFEKDYKWIWNHFDLSYFKIKKPEWRKINE